MEKVIEQPSFALLIRSAQRWPEALQVSDSLLGFGATVAIFFLGEEVCGGQMPLDKLQKSLNDRNIRCYADQPVAGMACLSLERMAQRLRQYELVIPI